MLVLAKDSKNSYHNLNSSTISGFEFNRENNYIKNIRLILTSKETINLIFRPYNFVTEEDIMSTKNNDAYKERFAKAIFKVIEENNVVTIDELANIVLLIVLGIK